MDAMFGWRWQCSFGASVAAGLMVFNAGCAEVIGASFGEEEPIPACELSAPIEPPATTGSAGDEEIVVVIHQTDLGESRGADGEFKYIGMGHDQDGSCSGPFDPPPCLPPAWTGGTPTDGSLGRDNAAGRLIQQQGDASSVSAVGTDEPNAATLTGEAAPFGMIRIRDFSGLPEDDQVVVDFYVAAAPKQVDPEAETPRFDGTYPFPIEQFSVAGATDADVGAPAEGDSVFRDPEAYVNRSTVVARFEDVPLGLFASRVVTYDLVVEAQLEYDRQTKLWSVADGMLSGSFPVEGVLETIPKLSVAALDQVICTDDPFYLSIKRLVCAAPDLRLDRGTDYGPDVCNALSFGVAFQAAPALLGPIAAVEDQPLCSAESDPANDDCSE
jgi:hypothetical protein